MHDDFPEMNSFEDPVAAPLGAAVNKQFARLRGLVGVIALLRREGEGWAEAGRLGRVSPQGLEEELRAFDPEDTGRVRPLGAPDKGWRASRGCAGAGIDLHVVVFLGDLAPEALQVVLAEIEQRIGWLLVEAMRAGARGTRDRALSVDTGATILSASAETGSRAQLGDLWIAELERALCPDMVAVCRVGNEMPRLISVSGGGVVSQPSAPRAALEQLARLAIERRAPQRFLRQEGAGEVVETLQELDVSAALVIPVYEGDPCRAVVVLLWSLPGAELPEDGAVDFLAHVLGQSLEIQARAHPAPSRRAMNWLGGWARALFGPRLLKFKLACVLIAIVLAGAAVTPTHHRPAFTARIEARERMVISAPFDGFIAAAPVELGDTVRAGEVLVRMEDADLRLERSRLSAQAAQLANQLRDARAQSDMAKVRDISAQIRQNTVETALAEDQIRRATIRAGADGLVISGDASRRVGGRVRLGEELLQVAQTESLSGLALIDEDWVADLPGNAAGDLLLAAYPDHPLPVHLRRITSQTETSGGTNSFDAWLEFDAPPDLKLMDGMRGIVRLDGGPTTVLGRYGRGIGRWFERKFWRRD